MNIDKHQFHRMWIILCYATFNYAVFWIKFSCKELSRSKAVCKLTAVWNH